MSEQLIKDVLAVAGSIASIGAIPLSVYLYLKSRIHKLLKIRREIVEKLSFRIGEGGALNTLVIDSVKNSYARKYKLRPNSILLDEIVEDLIAETINSPLLEAKRREEIINNLCESHSKKVRPPHKIQVFAKEGAYSDSIKTKGEVPAKTLAITSKTDDLKQPRKATVIKNQANKKLLENLGMDNEMKGRFFLDIVGHRTLVPIALLLIICLFLIYPEVMEGTSPVVNIALSFGITVLAGFISFAMAKLKAIMQAKKSP
jgi:hypothetical protein